MSLRDLLRRQDELEHALEDREPLLFREYRLVLQAVDKIRSVPTKPYADVRWPRAAILQCLKQNDKWMTRQQIQRDLEMGGYKIDDPETFNNSLAVSLKYHLRTGKLAHRDADGRILKPDEHKGARFRGDEYGLAEWVKQRKLDSLEKTL